MELFAVSAPDWGEEVLLGHHALHLIEHPFLDQPLGALRIPEMIFKNVSQMVLVYDNRVPQLTCTWMSLPGASGLGNLTSV